MPEQERHSPRGGAAAGDGAGPGLLRQAEGGSPAWWHRAVVGPARVQPHLVEQ